MGVYLRTKFQISSVILTRFRQGIILPPFPPQDGPLKCPQRLGLMRLLYCFWNNYSWVSSIRGYSNVISISKSIRPFEFFLKLFFMWAKDRVNLIIFTVALFIACQTWLRNVFICRQTRLLRSFCQQEIKGLP